MRFQIARILPGQPSSEGAFSESIVAEFGTPREVLFECKTNLEFGDQLRLRTPDDLLNVVASVVAVQYQADKIVVAARFQQELPNWIVKT